jgi:pimeloyl-ACP methyl ester carboxylesterase/DNA-binding winged helix-turn-helix (wHTH) protein
MTYAFRGFVLDTRRCEVRAGDAPLHLEPQVYSVLCYLVENRDRLVRKEELLDHVWGHRFVTPATLNSRIKALRRALGDDGNAQQVIETVRGRGFRFVAQVAEARAPSAPVSAAPAPPPSVPDAPMREPTHPVHPSITQRIHFCRGHDGARIAYATSGDGPLLLKTANWLTHLEYDWNSPVWRHWLAELSNGRTLVRYDERGSGLSDREVEDVSFEAWIRDLEVMMDVIGVEKAPLLGISQGCALAAAFAARHPERVSRLVLYGGFPLGRLKRAKTDLEREQAEMLMRVMPRGWGQDNPAFRYFFAAMFLPEGTQEQLAWFSELQRMTATPETAVRLLMASANIDIRDIAPTVTTPTLVLHATGDAVVPFEQGRMLASLIPGARLVPLEGRNHILLESEPAWPRFLAEVRSFLAEDDTDPVLGGSTRSRTGDREVGKPI